MLHRCSSLALPAALLLVACGYDLDEYDAEVQPLPREVTVESGGDVAPAQFPLEALLLEGRSGLRASDGAGDEAERPDLEEAGAEQLGGLELGSPAGSGQVAGEDEDAETTPPACVDEDGDGFSPTASCGGLDCDDADPDCHSGACCPLTTLEPGADGRGGGA